MEQVQILASILTIHRAAILSNTTSTSVFNLDLKAGYFFIENFTAGLRLGYQHTSTGGSGSGLTRIGVFGRYYFDGKIFAGAGITSVSPSTGNSSVEVPLEVGYAAFVTRNIAIEPALNFTKYDGGSLLV